MFPLIYSLIQALQPILVPLCFLTAWTLVVLVFWNISMAARDAIACAKQMHEIPCDNCQFFTGDYRLKCTVHPTYALTEEAINCLDFCSSDRPVVF